MINIDVYMLKLDISSCSYEAGRIKQHGNSATECGVKINKALDIDNGKWKCQVTSIDKTNNAISETKSVDVTVAGNFL